MSLGARSQGIPGLESSYNTYTWNAVVSYKRHHLCKLSRFMIHFDHLTEEKEGKKKKKKKTRQLREKTRHFQHKTKTAHCGRNHVKWRKKPYRSYAYYSTLLATVWKSATLPWVATFIVNQAFQVFHFGFTRTLKWRIASGMQLAFSCDSWHGSTYLSPRSKRAVRSYFEAISRWFCGQSANLGG